MGDRLGVGFKSKIVPVKPINEQMTLCKCYVLALGKNQNKSNISKSAADDALPSLFNIPVVGHLFVDKDNEVRMGGHDMALEKDENGKYKFKMLTVPYGTVPQQENVHYEEVEEKDGTINTYMVADIILWTGRYPELFDAMYNDEVYFAQSMEIVPSETSKDEGYTNIEKFQFSALCLLGKSDDPKKNVEPCFESARIEAYDFSANEEWTKLFEEFKEELARCYFKHNVEEGGERKMDADTIKSILIEFGLAEDTELSFEITEDMTVESLKAKIQEVYFVANGEINPEATVAEENVDTVEGVVAELAAGGNEGAGQATENFEVNPVGAPVKFAVELTYEEKRAKLCEALDNMCRWGDGEYKHYCLIDFDSKFVYCYFHFAGKDIEEEHGEMRMPYIEENEAIVLQADGAEKVRLVWVTKEDEEKITAEKAQFEELVEFKKARLEDDRRKAYAAVIEEFSDLGDIDEFKLIVKDMMAFENAEALTEKLYAVRGKYAKKPAKKPLDAIRIPVGFEAKKNDKQSELDEFMTKYLSANKK